MQGASRKSNRRGSFCVGFDFFLKYNICHLESKETLEIPFKTGCWSRKQHARKYFSLSRVLWPQLVILPIWYFRVYLFAGMALRSLHARPVLQKTGGKSWLEGYSGESFEHPFGKEYFEQTFEWYSNVIFELPFKFLLEIPSSDRAFK